MSTNPGGGQVPRPAIPDEKFQAVTVALDSVTRPGASFTARWDALERLYDQGFRDANNYEDIPGGDDADLFAAFPDPYDDLDADSTRVLDALPARGGAGTSTIAVGAGVDVDTVLRCLGVLAGYGFIERGDGGWRRRQD